jgi:hypothetical protein
MFLRPTALVVAVLALAGCGSVAASEARRTSVAATPSLPCTLPYGTRVTLIKPAPGSRAGGGAIVLAASRELPKTIALIATDSLGNVTHVATLERVAPNAHAHPNPPPFKNPIYYKAAGSALAAHRHYTLTLDDLAQNGCAPYAAMTGQARFSR